jgi:hypothetical protein
MKNLKNVVGVAFVTAASIGLMVACGGDDDPVDCLLDSECADGEVCEAELCVATCDTDGDCSAGEVCGDRTNGDGTVCVAAPDDTSCADEADPAAFCEAELGAGAICDTVSGDCQLLADPVYIAEIADVTTDTAACEGVADPGSDIQGIELQDAMGNSLGWGSIVNEAVVLEGNDEANFAIIDGTAPGLDNEGCVDSFSGNVLALGCTGSIYVEFLDDAGAPVALVDGQTIAVYEYGGGCSTGTTDDEWTVATCDDTVAVNDGTFDSCSNILGTGAGVGTVEVALGQ